MSRYLGEWERKADTHALFDQSFLTNNERNGERERQREGGEGTYKERKKGKEKEGSTDRDRQTD